MNWHHRSVKATISLLQLQEKAALVKTGGGGGWEEGRARRGWNLC